MKKFVNIRSLTPPSVARESERGPALQQELQQEFESNEVRVSLLVDSFVNEELALRAIPQRIYARKPCTSAFERPQASFLTFGRVFPASDVASKSRRPSSCGRPKNRSNQTFRKPFRPGSVVARGQERGPQRGRMPEEHSNQEPHPQGQEDRGRACPLSRCAPTRSPVLRFPCIRPYYATRGNEEGSCFFGKASQAGRHEELPVIVDGAEV